MARTGRPTRLDEVIRQKDVKDGVRIDVTVRDHIVEALAAGTPIEPAVRSSGIARSTYYTWLKRGRDAQRFLAVDGNNKSGLTQLDRDLADFMDEVDAAEAAWESNTSTILETLARGGREQVTTTVKVGHEQVIRDGVPVLDAEGRPLLREVELERTTRTEVVLPNPAVLQWRLERRFPERYSKRTEVTGAGGEPISIQAQVSQILGALDAFDDDEPIETTASSGAPALGPGSNGHGPGPQSVDEPVDGLPD